VSPLGNLPVSRLLSDQSRRRAMVAVTPVVLAGVVAVSTLGAPASRSRPGTPSAHVAHASDRNVLVGVPPPAAPPATSRRQASTPAAGRRVAPLDAGQRADVIAVARRFLHALLRYEVGQADRPTVTALRRTAARSLVRGLLSQPPRLTPGMSPRPGHVASLELSDDRTASPVLVAATVQRGDRLSPLTLTLSRRSGGWRVSSVG
jgi:hypothetical protein